MATELNFTKTAINNLPAAANRKVVYRDSGGASSEHTLYLYVGKRSRTFYFVKKFNGEKIEHRLGNFPTYPIEEARKQARKLSVDVDNGLDPREMKRAARQKGLTLLDVLEQYIEDGQTRANKPLRDSTAINYRRICDTHFSNEKHNARPGGTDYDKPGRNWYAKPAKNITFDMVERWHERASKYSVSSTNTAVRCLRAAFNHQINISRKQQSGEFTDNPFKGLALPADGVRDDYIEPDQLGAWLSAVEALPNSVSRDYLKILLFTGLRRREAGRLRWEQVNLQRRIITLAPAETKNSESHVVPLSDYLLEILSGMDSGHTGWVFPGSGKSGHLSEPRGPIARVNLIAGTHSTCHGLRRTYSNIAQWQAQIPDVARKKLMNHAIPKSDVTNTHYSNLPLDQKRKYQQMVTDKILELAGIDRTSQKVRTLVVAK